MAEPRVLFVSHEASRSGAPLSLLQFLRWLRTNTEVDFEVLLLDGGPLVDDFAALAPTRCPPSTGRGPTGWLERLLGESRLERAAGAVRGRRWGMRPWRFDVCYLNSVFSAPALHCLPPSGATVVARVPELDMSFRHWLPPRDREALLARTDRFIAVSRAVRDTLVDGQGVAPDRIALIHGFVEPPPDLAADHRPDLGVPEGHLVVGGAGTTDWRKGPDLFVQVARTVLGRRPDAPVSFVWLGGHETDPGWRSAVADVAACGLDGRVRFPGSVPDGPARLAAMDLFALTSRQDPFPRVALEAAAGGVPVVTFDNGGAVELVEQGCGFVVPYLDVEAMADRLLELIDDPARRREMGEVGARVVREQFVVDVGAPKLLAEIRRAVAGGGTR